MEYEEHQELVEPQNEEKLKALMAEQGSTFVTDAVTDVATGRRSLEFKRPLNG